MAELHDLIRKNGRQAVLVTAEDDRQHRAITTAAAYMADESNENHFFFAGWAQASLPHRRVASEQPWRVETDFVTLLVEPGRRPLLDGTNPYVGVPYGSRARLILLYLQTEALRTRSRDVVLGRTLNAWMFRLGIPRGGKTVKEVQDQADRIARCRLSFHMRNPNPNSGRNGLMNQNILDSALFIDDEHPDQGNLFLEVARLSEGFFEQLQKHPVPVEDAAIRQLNNNSMALDLYCWLAYRLHSLTKATKLSWMSIYRQFGTGFGLIKHFKPAFCDNLALAMGVYPDAKVDVVDDGLMLYPSKPPVSKTLVPVIV